MSESTGTPGDRIRAEREAREWTQEYLAELAGVRSEQVAKWEAGQGIGLTNAQKIADALEKSLDWLRGKERPESVLEVEDESAPRSITTAIVEIGEELSPETIRKALGVQWGGGAPDLDGAKAYLRNLEAIMKGRQLASERESGERATAEAEAQREAAGIRKATRQPKKPKKR